MNGSRCALRHLAPPLMAASLAACAAHAPVASGPGKWAYLGNDPDGTQNIYLRGLTTDKKSGTVSAEFRFEFIGPRALTDPDLKQISYIERRDRIQVDCTRRTLDLQDETYYDVDDKQVYHVKPQVGVAAAPVFAGGISDIIYQGACGKSLAWTSLGQDP